MQETLDEALRDIVALLKAHDVRFALIGGLAVSLRAEPRTTRDVDVVVALDLADGFNLQACLPGSAFEPLFAGAEELVTSFVFPLKHKPTGVKVDVLLGMSGFEHQAVDRAETVDYLGTPTPVVTAEDLLLLKVMASRPRDHEDALQIVLRRGPKLDWDYLTVTAQGLDEAVAGDLSERLEALRTRYAHLI